MSRAKYTEVAQLIQARVASGDWGADAIPGERKIAREFGVSHMTARKAIQHLLQNGTLRRTDGASRRPPKRAKRASKLIVTLLSPAFVSFSHRVWHRELEKAVEKRGGVLRPVSYVHAGDSMFTAALEGESDAIFLLPPQDMPSVILDKVVANRHRLVTLFHDLTGLGVPCVDNSVPAFAAVLVRHLHELGHRRVCVFNTQPLDTVLGQRIEAAQQAAAELDVACDVTSSPVELYGLPEVRARDVLTRLLKSRRLRATGLICTVGSMVTGVLRAAHDCGVRIPSDLSVCAFDGKELASLLVPSVTTLDLPARGPLLTAALDRVLSSRKKKAAASALIPKSVSVWRGESTGPPS